MLHQHGLHAHRRRLSARLDCPGEVVSWQRGTFYGGGPIKYLSSALVYGVKGQLDRAGVPFAALARGITEHETDLAWAGGRSVLPLLQCQCPFALELHRAIVEQFVDHRVPGRVSHRGDEA